MGSEADNEPSSTPKLSLFSLPRQPPEPPGMLTPPLQTAVSVPFQWEEAPGKPRPSTTITTTTLPKPRTARCLELPPRLLKEVRVTNMPSPTTVLDGPYVARSVSYSSSSFSKGSFRNPETGQVGGVMSCGKRGYFGSWRWGASKENNREVVGGSFDFSSSVVDEEGGGGGESSNNVIKISRIRRRGSFLSLSHTKSQLWASFKQVVPWRHRQEKLRKMST